MPQLFVDVMLELSLYSLVGFVVNLCVLSLLVAVAIWAITAVIERRDSHLRF